MNDRIFDTVPSHTSYETRVVNGREYETVSYSDLLAMTSDELHALLPGGREVLAKGIQRGAMARLQREAEAQQQESA